MAISPRVARVLLIDDDIAEISAVKRVLSRSGHQAVLATSIADAVTLAEQERPAAAVVSAACENGGGVGLARRLLEESGGPRLPVLVLGEEKEVPEGAVRVPRPLDPAQLERELELALGGAPGTPIARMALKALSKGSTAKGAPLAPAHVAGRRAAADALLHRADEMRRERARAAPVELPKRPAPPSGAAGDRKAADGAALASPPAGASPAVDRLAADIEAELTRLGRDAPAEGRAGGPLDVDRAAEEIARRAEEEAERRRRADEETQRRRAEDEAAAKAPGRRGFGAAPEAGRATEEALDRTGRRAARGGSDGLSEAQGRREREATQIERGLAEAQGGTESEAGRLPAAIDGEPAAAAGQSVPADEPAELHAPSEEALLGESLEHLLSEVAGRLGKDMPGAPRREDGGATAAAEQPPEDAPPGRNALPGSPAEVAVGEGGGPRSPEAVPPALEFRGASPSAEVAAGREPSTPAPPGRGAIALETPEEAARRRIRPAASGPPPAPAPEPLAPPREFSEAEGTEAEAGASPPPAEPELSPPPAELSAGTLAEAPMPKLLALASRTRLSGRLDFGSAAPRSVYFEEGRVVGATSGAPQERVEDVALRLGFLTRDQHRQVGATAGLSSRRTALLLLERGFLKPEELTPLARRRAEEVVFALFSEVAAPFRYAAARVPPEERTALGRGPLVLALEGVRRKWVDPRLGAALGGPSTLFAPAPRAPQPSELGLSEPEARVAALADGLRTLDEILADSPLEPLPTRQVLAGLVMVGALTARFQGGGRREEAGSRSIDLGRLRDKLDQVRRADYFAILGVGRDGTPYEIREAAERLLGEFDPGRFHGVREPGLQESLEEVRRVVAEAREVLSDEVLRSEYVEALGIR